MLAVKGISTNGVVRLVEKAPTIETEVLVIFPDVNIVAETSSNKSTDAKSFMDKYRGILKGTVDEKEMRTEAAIEKYERID